MSIAVIGMTSEKHNGKVYLTDSRNETEDSNQLLPLLHFMLEDYDIPERNVHYIRCVWDLQAFFEPILALLKPEYKDTLVKSGRVEFVIGDEKLRLFWIPDKLFGVGLKQRVKVRGNFYQEERYEQNIYQLRDFYQNIVEPPQTALQVERLGHRLLDEFIHIGMQPTKLISPANVFQECVLDKMTFVNIYRLPDNAIDFADLSARTMTDEWREVYQIGRFEKTWDYDMTSAYPSIIADLPNLHNAEYIESDKEIECDWGLMTGIATITKDVSPAYKDKLYPKGKFKVDMSTEMAKTIRKYNIGDFECQHGYFIKLTRNDKPFDYIMRRMFEYRGGNQLRDILAKRMANSFYGKLAQINDDGSYGDHLNPIYAKMITDRCKNRVVEFLYDNHVENDVIAILVDGVLLSKFVEVPKLKQFGQWRFNGEFEALVLSDSEVWYGDKRPMGLTFDEALKQTKNFGVDKAEYRRMWAKYPDKASDVLKRNYQSTAITI